MNMQEKGDVPYLMNSEDVNLERSLFGSSRSMNLGFLVELAREFRFWAPSQSTCPWGAIGLLVLVTGLTCWCCGFAVAACVLSPHCRRIISLVLRALISSTQVPVVPNDLRGRLAEYHRSG